MVEFTDLRCHECDEKIRPALVQAKQQTEYETTYAGNTKEKGEGVRCRMGLACECTEWYEPRDIEHFFRIPADNFPNQWKQNYYES